jgi:hypothetical protein
MALAAPKMVMRHAGIQDMGIAVSLFNPGILQG